MKNFFSICFVLFGCSDIGYPRVVEGKVTDIGSRFGRNRDSESFAIFLTPINPVDPRVLNIAGSNPMAVDCYSTRCAALKAGDCVSLACGISHRIGEPDVLVCKMNKVIQCPTSVD